MNGIPLAEPVGVQLLAALRDTANLEDAAVRTQLSRKSAQDYLDALNNLAGCALTERDGTTVRLTTDGQNWLARVQQQAENFRQFLDQSQLTELLAMHYNISTRNQLKSTIARVEDGAVNSEVRLSLGTHTLTAIITRASVERLQLAAGDTAYALIKASDVMLAAGDIGGQISARNIISGTVSRVESGAVNDEITLDIGGGQNIVAIITRASAERLGLKAGSAASAIIKASNIMIGK